MTLDVSGSIEDRSQFPLVVVNSLNPALIQPGRIRWFRTCLGAVDQRQDY